MANIQTQYPSVRTVPLNQNLSWLQRLYQGLAGSPDQMYEFNQFNPDQQQALSQILQMSLGGLQKTPFDFGPIAQQARENFQQKTIPSIAERFAGLGGLRSSAFNRAIGQAGAGLETNLGALGAQYNLAQQSNLGKLLQIGLAPQTQQGIMPGTSGIFGNLGQGAGQLAGLGLRTLTGF